jgi:hypothetical protein
MFVEADGLIVIAVEQTLLLQSRLIDQARKMNIVAQFLVWAARMPFSHRCRAKSQAAVQYREHRGPFPTPGFLLILAMAEVRLG